MSKRNRSQKQANLPGLARGVNSVAALLVAGALAGCLIRPPRTVHEVPPGVWAATLRDASRAPFRDELAPETAPREVWREGMERGLASAPIVHDHVLILGSSARVLTLADARNGREYWHRRFNGPVVGSPLRIGDRVIVGTATRDGRVVAFTLDRGRRVWQRRLRAPLTADPLAAGGKIYAATLRNELYALDERDGQVVWRRRTPGMVLGAPVLHEDGLLLATARDTLFRVRLDNGAIEGATVIPGAPSAPAALSGQRLLLPVHPAAVASFDARTLAPLRVDSLDAPVLAAPAVAEDGSAYVLTRNGTVWRLAPEGGAERLADLGGTARESLTLARNGLLVGRLDGTLVLLRRDGSEVWRQSYPGSIRAPVALADGAAYLSLLNGRFIKLQ